MTSGVICGNMAASRRHGMTSGWKKKFWTSARGAGFYPFVLRRSATEETRWVNRISAWHSLSLRPPSLLAPCGRSDEERNGKAGFNYFPRNKTQEEEKKKKKGKVGNTLYRPRRLNFNGAAPVRRAANHRLEFATNRVDRTVARSQARAAL